MVLPIPVKTVAVSTTINPVTQTAEVDVNKASIQVIPLTVELGSIKRRVPTKMTNRKLKIKIIAGCIAILLTPRLIRLNSIKNSRLIRMFVRIASYS